MIYSHPSVNGLAALLSNQHHNFENGEPRGSSTREERITAMIEKYTKTLPPKSKGDTPPNANNE